MQSGTKASSKLTTPRPIVPIVVVQGAQWGSESKGMVAAHLCKIRNVKWVVRTGTVNAGHTVMWPEGPEGFPQKMQQLPTGWVNPQTKLVIGAGAYIHPQILATEIELISSLIGTDIRERLYIDSKVSLHLPEHTDQAKLENRHHAIGATGKGCSVAITDKIRYRGKGYRLFKEWLEDGFTGTIGAYNFLTNIKFVDTVDLLHTGYDNGESILLEGTQGSLLDLNLGPYPYTTHKCTQAANWVAEAGLSPAMEYEIVMVARTFPIRVAGNSGPMTGETTWPNLARDINRKLMVANRLPQRVKNWAIEDFERILHDTANEDTWRMKLPTHNDGSPNYDMHKWPEHTRIKYQVALSELNAVVLKRCPERTMVELNHLFELTTVTKKLRRIAQWNDADVKWSCKVNRATNIVLTFINYQFPELWDLDRDQLPKAWKPEHARYIARIKEAVGVHVGYVTTGPRTEFMIPTSELPMYNER